MTKPETLPGAIKGASAVVFASSASRKGGNAEAVDYKGVENIARCVVFGVFVGIGVVGEVMVMGCVYVALPIISFIQIQTLSPPPHSACIDEKIPRLLVVSSGAVSRPDSLGYKVGGR